MGEWQTNEIEELKRLYKENNMPSDHLVKDKLALDNFTIAFNKRITSARTFTAKEVADKLFQLRKSGKLPRIRK